MCDMRIGIDLGGTKIEAVALDANGHQLFNRRIATPRSDYGAIVAKIVELITLIEDSLGQKGTIGIGIPGTISPTTGYVKNANTVELIGKPLDKDLTERLKRPIRMLNDANCFALSEATDGAGQGAATVFGIILGTGCGGALVINKKILTGRNHIGGEWGHNRLPDLEACDYPLPPCYCGHLGCNETYLSGVGIARDHKKVTATELTAKEIASRAEAGDEAARATLDRFELRLAKALAVVINIVDPDVIVAGGGISNIARIYDNVKNIWKNYIFSDHVTTEFVKAKHGDASGVRGAAWLWD